MVEKRYGQRHKGMQDENNLRETPTPGTPRCPRRMGGDVSGHQTAWETAPRPLCPSPGRPQTWSPARPTGVPHSLRGRRPKNWRHDCHGRKPPHVPQRRRKRPFWTRPEPSHVGHRRCRTCAPRDEECGGGGGGAGGDVEVQQRGRHHEQRRTTTKTTGRWVDRWRQRRNVPHQAANGGPHWPCRLPPPSQPFSYKANRPPAQGSHHSGRWAGGYAEPAWPAE